MVPVNQIQNITSDYVNWNSAFLKYFFNPEREGQEVILFIDEDLITEIGIKNNLGTYGDFLKTILVQEDLRFAIYDRISGKARRDVDVNRNIKKIITEFPNILEQLNSNYDLAFFNYIVLYICNYANNESSSYYKNLNKTIKEYLPKERKVQALHNLDCLLDKIENWSLHKNHGIFRARRIGNLSYMGLLNYQVVLKPIENNALENILYSYNILIDENATFPELANKLLPYVPQTSLRNKIINAIKHPVYAEWFLNKTKAFDHNLFSKSEKNKGIIVKRKGTLSFRIDIEDLSLKLISDLCLNEKDEPKGFKLDPSGKDNYGYYIKSIQLLKDKPVKFQNYNLTTAHDTLQLQSLPINEVNFFIAIETGYLYTLHPSENLELLIVVKKSSNGKWENWASNNDNIEEFKRVHNEENLIDIFGDEYFFYTGYNLKKSFNKNDNNVIYDLPETKALEIKKLGGLKVNTNTYLDIGLPFFKIRNKSIDPENVTTKIYRNGGLDKDIEVKLIDEKFMIFINEHVFIEKPVLIIIKFSIDNIEESFDFSIVGTPVVSHLRGQICKLDKWGELDGQSQEYIQGNRLVIYEKISLNTNRHPLSTLVKDSSYDDNYFIYLLSGISALNEKDYIKRIQVYKAIDAALVYLRSKGYTITESYYSRSNFIRNLFALGFINKYDSGNQNERFQLLPPSLIKIEKSFEIGSKQVYQLLGVRSKYLVQKLIQFCEKESIIIKYKRYNISENNDLEKALLPEIIYLNAEGKIDIIKQFFLETFDINLEVNTTYHLGDTLTRFLATINNYKGKYLIEKVNLANQPLNTPVSETFPRIVESQNIYKTNGTEHKLRFLEIENKQYFKIKNLQWAKLYVANSHGAPILMVRKQYNGSTFTFSRDTFIPSTYKLPDIVYRAFCSINHGVPQTEKIFIKNGTNEFRGDNKMFMYFDYYKFSSKENRLENVTNILAGSKELANTQIKYYENINETIKYVKCSLFNSIKSAVFIFNRRDKIIGFVSNQKEIFVSADLISNEVQAKKCTYQDQEFDILKLSSPQYSINKIISKLMDKDLLDFDYKTPYQNITIDPVREEKIKVKELIRA